MEQNTPKAMRALCWTASFLWKQLDDKSPEIRLIHWFKASGRRKGFSSHSNNSMTHPYPHHCSERTTRVPLSLMSRMF